MQEASKAPILITEEYAIMYKMSVVDFKGREEIDIHIEYGLRVPSSEHEKVRSLSFEWIEEASRNKTKRDFF
jgi:hypothetical protein